MSVPQVRPAFNTQRKAEIGTTPEFFSCIGSETRIPENYELKWKAFLDIRKKVSD
jgi:hypothetical protein